MQDFDSPALIIARPGLQSTAQRLTSGALALVAWSLWLYLWLPLVTLAAWGLGGSAFHETMLVQGGLGDLGEFVARTGPVIAALCSALVLWALYNYARFRGRERRRPRQAASVIQIAGRAGLSPADLSAAQRSRRLFVCHDPSGRLMRVSESPSWQADGVQALAGPRRVA